MFEPKTSNTFLALFLLFLSLKILFLIQQNGHSLFGIQDAIGKFIQYSEPNKIDANQALFYEHSSTDFLNYGSKFVHPIHFLSSLIAGYGSYNLYSLISFFLFLLISFFYFQKNKIQDFPWMFFLFLVPFLFLKANIFLNCITHVLCLILWQEEKRKAIFFFYGVLSILLTLFFLPFLILNMLFLLHHQKIKKNVCTVLFILFTVHFIWLAYYSISFESFSRAIAYWSLNIKHSIFKPEKFILKENETNSLIMLTFLPSIIYWTFLLFMRHKALSMNFILPYFLGLILVGIVHIWIIPFHMYIVSVFIFSITLWHYLKIGKEKVAHYSYLFSATSFFFIIGLLYFADHRSYPKHASYNAECSKRTWILSWVDLPFFNIQNEKINKIIFMDLKLIPENIDKMLKKKELMQDSIFKDHHKYNLEFDFLRKEKLNAYETRGKIKFEDCIGLFLRSNLHPLFEEKPYRRVRDIYDEHSKKRNISILLSQ